MIEQGVNPGQSQPKGWAAGGPAKRCLERGLGKFKRGLPLGRVDALADGPQVMQPAQALPVPGLVQPRDRLLGDRDQGGILARRDRGALEVVSQRDINGDIRDTGGQARVGEEQRDHLFRYVADQALQAIRDSDVITRYEDGKLAVIMPQTKADNALNLVSRIQRTYREQPLRIKGRTISLSMNFGVASTETGNVTDPQMLLRCADKNLTRSKNVSQENPLINTGKNNRPKIIPLRIGQKEQD